MKAIPFWFLLWLTLGHSILASDLSDAKARLEKADKSLNLKFQNLLKTETPDQVVELRKLQREWIDYRDYYAKDQPRQNGEGELPLERAASYWSALADLTEIRVKFLGAWQGKGVSEGWTGDYSDFYGGHLAIKQTDKELEFNMDVVRGPTFHTGEIGGNARLKDQKAIYTTDDTPPARIILTQSPRNRVVVESKDADEYHGARAYFDAVFYKTSDQPDFPKEQK